MHALQRLTAILLCTSVGWRGSRVVAQILYPQCTNSALQWTFNKEGQSPCQVGATLEGSCFGNRWNLSAISPGQEYGGPNALANSNICQCNTVVYSLISACGACQNAPFPLWSRWRFNCSNTDVAIAKFPNTTSSGIDIPAWAYLNVTAADSWNKDAAFANATLATTTTVTTTPTTPTPPAATASVSNSTAANGDNTTKSSSKAGPIAGGVVGGIVGLAALALAGFIFYRRSNRPKQTIQHRDEKVEISDATSPVSGPGSEFFGHIRSPSDDPPKLYNPSDPSTFPPSLPPVPPGYTPQSPVGSALSGQTGSAHGGVWAPMGYKGAPEV